MIHSLKGEMATGGSGGIQKGGGRSGDWQCVDDNRLSNTALLRLPCTPGPWGRFWGLRVVRRIHLAIFASNEELPRPPGKCWKGAP